ncbi:MAG: prepilin peptidase [Chloroflexota bacterium]|nr:prepilin peptidase [Chloroflexota bacterium]
MAAWVMVSASVLGGAIGSFLNVCIDRLPRGQSIVDPPSHCPDCGKPLQFVDLIPVFSYLWLRGRCRYCGARIPVRVLAVEAGTAVVFALLALGYGAGIEFLMLAYYFSLLLLLAVIDLEQGIIPNRIVYPGLAVGLITAPLWAVTDFARPFFWGGPGMVAALLSSVSGGIVLFAIFFGIVLASRGGMGWGDVKMAALVGLAVGFSGLPAAFLTAVLSGGLVAAFLLAARRKGRKDAIPFGPFLALGGMVALLWGKEFTLWYFRLVGL